MDDKYNDVVYHLRSLSPWESPEDSEKKREPPQPILLNH